MSLKEQIQKDGAEVFLNSEEFAEEITYLSGTVSRVIKAVVVRYELSPAEENVYRSLKRQAEVYIANDAQQGVTAIHKKDDRVWLKDSEDIEQEARINEVTSRDEGMWHLMVGW